jgi:hypothetical protein
MPRMPRIEQNCVGGGPGCVKEMQGEGGGAAGASDLLRDLIPASPDKIPNTPDKIPDTPDTPDIAKRSGRRAKGCLRRCRRGA